MVWLLAALACGPGSAPGGDTGGPLVRAEPPLLDVGRSALGSSVVARLELHNDGAEDVDVDLWWSGTAFQPLETPPRPVRLTAHGSWTFHLRFTPSRPQHEDILVVRSDAQPGGVLAVVLRGEGTDPLAR